MGSLVHFRRGKRCGDVLAGITSRSETRSWSWRKSIGVTSALLASTVTFGSQLVRGRRSANRADCPPGVDRTEYSRAREKWSKRAEMRETLSGVLPLSDRVKAQHHHKTMWNTLTTTKSTSSSYPVHLVESHLPDCMCLWSPRRTFDSHKPGLFHFNPRSCSCLLCLQTAQLPEAKGISRILSSRIVTRSIKSSLTFARRLGAHRKPSSISLPLYSASIRVESLGFTPSFQRETSSSRCIHLTSSTLRKKILSTREPSFFRTW